ncbi:polysaccharide pyruvyl transferase family protein [Neobacillus sp. 3P2-tot-E-2]|uniref:polysaccharide pyruvyl transferase family protein n=1 Tax=Neobacillus sp. 3P2-tot-E-2 TaxID=3132212 RepID=UPI00399F9757
MDKNKKFIALHGAYFPNNFGDVLILAIQAKWIKEITGKEIVLPFATEIYRTSLDSSTLRGLESIKKSDKLVYGAGGYFGEPLTNKWKWGYSFLKKHTIPAEYAMLNKIKYAVIGTGVGPITNIFTRKEMVRICKNASVLAVRDEESKQYLVEYGVPKEKINVTVDVALSLSKNDIPEDSISKIENMFTKVKGLIYGFHIGVDMDSLVYGDKARILFDESIKFINENTSVTPVLIVDNNNNEQIKAIKYLKENINRECIIYIHENIWDTAALLEKLDVVLTNKLHVGIVSYALGTNCISIPYHPKTTRFYKQINCEELCMPLLDIEQNEIYDLLYRSIEERWRVELNNRRGEILPKLKASALLNKKILQDFLTD